MSCSTALRRRLSRETSDLKNKFGSGKVGWTNLFSRGEGEVRVTMNTNNSKTYRLRIYIPNDYPNSCPDMVVIYPNRQLKRRDGTDLTHGDHAWGTRDGYTKICHHRPNLWTPDDTLTQAFLKGRLWLEAYELHLTTGKPMGIFLREMPAQ